MRAGQARHLRLLPGPAAAAAASLPFPLAPRGVASLLHWSAWVAAAAERGSALASPRSLLAGLTSRTRTRNGGGRKRVLAP